MHLYSSLFFFTEPATTEIYTLSLHDALPIYSSHTKRRRQSNSIRQNANPFLRANHDRHLAQQRAVALEVHGRTVYGNREMQDRKSTRLNSSHVEISYAVFCLKKKKKKKETNK